MSFRSRSTRILRDRLQERRRGVEAVVAAAERRGEIEAKAVDARDRRAVAQRIHREAQHGRPIERQRVAAAGIVDVARAVVGVGR